MNPKLSGISIYPIKSARGVGLSVAQVDEMGLRGDRMMMVTDRSGRFLTQRDEPSLALVEALVDDASVTLSAPGAGRLKIQLDQSVVPGPVEVWRDTCLGVDLGPEVAEWISLYLGQERRIVRVPEIGTRRFDPKFGDGKVSFADGFPLLLIGESALEVLNSRLPEPIPMNRFRPNLVISGSEPFAEDKWHRIKIGGCEFKVVKPCARCVVTTIDQSSGDPTGKEPLKTLADFRQAKDVIPESFDSFGLGPNDVLFGQNLIPLNVGNSLAVGDSLEVLE